MVERIFFICLKNSSYLKRNSKVEIYKCIFYKYYVTEINFTLATTILTRQF